MMVCVGCGATAPLSLSLSLFLSLSLCSWRREREREEEKKVRRVGGSSALLKVGCAFGACYAPAVATNSFQHNSVSKRYFCISPTNYIPPEVTMEYSVQNSLSEESKTEISAWIKDALDEISVENDDVFIQYILVMISSGKTMREISVELEAFLGNPESNEFVLKLGDMLRPMDISVKSSNMVKIGGSSKSPNNANMNQSLKSDRSSSGSRKGNDRLDGPLSSGRTTVGKQPQGRLIQSALKSSLQPQNNSSNKRRGEGDSAPTGFTTNKRNRANDAQQRPPAPSGTPQHPPHAPVGMPQMGMFDPAMMSQQMESYAQMMGFDSSAAMMEFYNMSMMGMMQGGPMGGQWAPPPLGRGYEGRGGFRGR